MRVTVTRAVLVNSTYLSSYDEIKHRIMQKFNMEDGLTVQFLASTAASFVVATACTPADNVKTRIMTQKVYNDIPNLCKASMGYYKDYPR